MKPPIFIKPPKLAQSVKGDMGHIQLLLLMMMKIYIVVATPRKALATSCKQGNKQPGVLF
jgi:hypothetical protein